YIALSYAWGSVYQKIYTCYTILRARPRTIADAMLAVKRLGFRYLWVDSPCIDQSDENHKAGQIAIMHTIYQAA
ncbi:heterokaryon incompatibility, partial [Halenospora varia]